MEAKPNEPGVSGDRPERRRRVTSPVNDPVATRRAGVGKAEDRNFLGTDDPAFWIKEHDQE